MKISYGFQKDTLGSVRKRRLLTILFLCVLIGGATGQLAGAGQTITRQAERPANLLESHPRLLPKLSERIDSAPPLPADCDELAQPGEDPPELCVYGYVYLDDIPVDGALVTIIIEEGSVTTSTQSGPGSIEPYFAAALSELPLDVSDGDLVTVESIVSGESNSTTFTAVADAQQVDVWLSTTCGPTTIPGGLISMHTTWTQACSPYLVTGNLVVAVDVILTVEPGTIVQIDPGRALHINGWLQVPGSANAMAVFTTNTDPIPGTWGYILVAGSGRIDMTYGLIEYGGGAAVSDNGALRVDGAVAWLEHIVLRYSANDGIHVFNGGALFLTESSINHNAKRGVYLNTTATDILLSYNTINHNQDGGILAIGGGDFWIILNTIADNSSGPGVAIDSSATTGLIAGNLITGNTNTGGDGGGIRIKWGDVDISDNIVTGNLARRGGGIHVWPKGIVLDDNIVVGNTATLNGGGIVYSGGNNSYINLNVIADNTAVNDGGGLYLGSIGATNFVGINAILRNEAGRHGGGLWVDDNNARLIENTIISNVSGDGMGGVYVKNHPQAFYDNNIYDNSDYDLFNANAQGTADVIAENNWWFAFEDFAIREKIWDWYDDPTLGFVDFEPFRTNFALAAPISPPEGFAAVPVSTTAISVTWHANVENDVAGYKVYYDLDEPGFPYSGTVALEGPSPIDVGDALSTTLTGLPPGTYHVTVTAYDTLAGGVQDQTKGHESWYTVEATIPLPAPPLADFSADPTEGPAPLIVDFTDLSTGNVDDWLWDFGDGGISVVQMPAHVYNSPGIYTVALQASGPAGTDVFTRTNYITVYEPVVAGFSGSPTSGIAPLQVDFSNASSGDFDTCLWEFGDGGASSDCNDPSHTYNTAGMFTVSLTVSGLGGSDTATAAGYVTVYEPVVAAFNGTPTSGIAPLQVDFVNISTGDYDTCAWDFGDGNTSTNCADPSNNYTASGVYTVSLTISGPGGTSTETKADYITVYEPVMADFSATPTSGVAPLTVDFMNLSTGDFDTCLWEFGDGDSSDQCVDPSHTYTAEGLYSVTLTVSGPGGGDTITRPDYIDVAPMAYLEGIITLQGRADHSGTEVCAWDGGQLMDCTATDADGDYALTLPEGTCDVTVEKARYLDSEKTGVVLSSGITETLPSLMLKGGDTNDDDVINILDLSFMGARFGLNCGEPGWDDRADINGDCTVNIQDLALAGGNFLNTSPLPWP